MAPVRLRHPNGVATIQVPLDDDTYTVQDLQQQIYTATQILPSLQDLKAGYPPYSLAVFPQLPVSSLGLKQGEQIIVSQRIDDVTTQSVQTSAPIPTQAQSNSPPTVPLATKPSSSSTGPDCVSVGDSYLIHHIVPDDNSCLFSSIALIFKQDINKASDIRKIATEGIRNDPETYSEAILGLPPPQYISKMLSPQTWGGAIELAALANHFNTEIASVDVETGRIDRFEPSANAHPSGNRCIVIYSGIHYDAATLSPTEDAPQEWHQAVFPITSSDPSTDPILTAAQALATKLRAKKAYTNTATFDLKCEVCGTGLKGEAEARKHAEATGHVRFGEYA